MYEEVMNFLGNPKIRPNQIDKREIGARLVFANYAYILWIDFFMNVIKDVTNNKNLSRIYPSHQEIKQEGFSFSFPS